MAERDACLVVSAATWFWLVTGKYDPSLSDVEYRLRCHIVTDGAHIVVATVLGVADASGIFRRLTPAPLMEIPQAKIIGEETWDRDH